jgi:hypothetical protein
MKKSDKFSERIVERSTVITYNNNNIYTNITQKEDSMVVSYIPPTSGDNKNGSYTKTKYNMAQRWGWGHVWSKVTNQCLVDSGV